MNPAESSDVKVTLALRLREARERMGMSREELANAASLQSSDAIYQLEHCERSGLAWELSRLAAALHIDMHDLLSDKPIEKPVVLWCGEQTQGGGER